MAKRIISFAAILTLLLTLIPFNVRAEGEIGYSVDISPSEPSVGDEVTVTVSLENYTADSSGIRGLQIDITNIDTGVLSVVAYTTLIDDDSALSNKATHQTGSKRLRLMYVNDEGTIPAPCDDVFQVKLKVNESLTASGIITLPVTVKIQTADGSKQTLTSNVTISYTVDSPTVFSVDIEWGSMEFTYSSGDWDPETHSYGNQKWNCDDGSNRVTVINNGLEDINAAFSYAKASGYEHISGALYNDGNELLTEAVTVSANGQSTSAYLRLQGEPTGSMKSAIIGAVTVQISEVKNDE